MRSAFAIQSDPIYHVSLSLSLPPRKDDVDAGIVFSEAKVKAWTTSPNSIEVEAKGSGSTPLHQKPEILLEKHFREITKAAGIHPTYSDAGDTATFDIYITNTGNTRLNRVVLTDDMFGESITCDDDFSGTISGFLPLRPSGHRIVCEAVALLTSVDVDTGYINSTAEVSWSTTDASQRMYMFFPPSALELDVIVFLDRTDVVWAFASSSMQCFYGLLAK